MSSPSLTVSCSDSTDQSPFSYSLGCVPAADTWAVSGSPSTVIGCNDLSAQSAYQPVLSGDCTSSTASTSTALISDDGFLFVTHLSEFIIPS
ncbi:MAG: hypothetical protein VW907_00475 [Opitutae bacterium]